MITIHHFVTNLRQDRLWSRVVCSIFTINRHKNSNPTFSRCFLLFIDVSPLTSLFFHFISDKVNKGLNGSDFLQINFNDLKIIPGLVFIYTTKPLLIICNRTRSLSSTYSSSLIVNPFIRIRYTVNGIVFIHFLLSYYILIKKSSSSF